MLHLSASWPATLKILALSATGVTIAGKLEVEQKCIRKRSNRKIQDKIL